MFSKKRLSIDIRGHIIKFAEGSLVDDDVVKIKRAAYLDAKDIISGENRLTCSQESIELIKRFMKKHKFSVKKGILSISDNKIITRVIKLPKLPVDDLTEIIKIEAPKYLPVDINRYHVDYRILDSFNEDEKSYYNILICAVPKDITREYMSIFASCGLELSLIDIHQNCVSRLYQYLEFDDVAVIDCSAEGADFLIIEKGNFDVYTTFQFQIPDYNELYREPLEYSIEKIENQLADLTKEVHNYINFYLARHEGKKIDTIYITGDLALIEGIESYFQKALGINVCKGFDDSIGIIKPRKPHIDENFYCSNIAAMLRGV